MEHEDWELKTERYLNNKMTSEEIIAFEQEQDLKPELKTYVKLSLELKQVLNKKKWSNFKNNNEYLKEVKSWYKSDDVITFNKHIKEQSQIYFKNEKKSNSLKKYYWISAAAIIVLLVAISLQFNTQSNMKSLYADYATWKDLPSFIVKDDNTLKDKENIELLFKKGDYANCIIKADLFLKESNESITNILIYKGVSLLQLDKNEEALKIFKNLSNRNSIDSSKGLWYSMLVYLKTENKEQALKMLEKITMSSRNYRYNDALELINKINND